MIVVKRPILVLIAALALSVAACVDNSDRLLDAADAQGRAAAVARQADAALPTATAQADANAAALKVAQDALAAARAAGEADAAKIAAMQGEIAKAQADAAAARAKADDIAAIKIAAERRAAAAAAEVERIKAAEAKAQADDAAKLTRGGEVAGAVLPFVPPPYGELAGLVVGVVGGIGAWIGRQRAAKFKTVAERIVEVIEAAQTDAGVVNFDDPLTRAKMKAELGPDGHALVKSVVARTLAADA